jgi:predicted NBD/HSP70 family sugar kinase
LVAAIKKILLLINKKPLYYIGFDIGSSSVKVALVESATGKKISVLHEPKNEMDILQQIRTGQNKILSYGGGICVRPQNVL